jgi:hypothetical protein
MIKISKATIAPLAPSFIFFLMGLLGAVSAYFTVSALSTHNTFDTASMKLVIGDDNETQSTHITETWNGSNLLPGSQLPERRIEVYNTSPVDADHVDIQFSYTGSEDIAKNFIFSHNNHAFRYGASSDASSVNLISALKGTTDPDYIVTQGANGEPFTAATVDGIDGSTRDGKISLHELSLFGKIRIQKGEERGALAAGTATDLWLNADISENLAAQNSTLDMKITVSLDQHPSQF